MMAKYKGCGICQYNSVNIERKTEMTYWRDGQFHTDGEGELSAAKFTIVSRGCSMLQRKMRCCSSKLCQCWSNSLEQCWRPWAGSEWRREIKG